MIAFAQTELARLLHRHVHVVAAREVAVDAQEAVALVAQVEQTRDLDGLADPRRLFALAALTVATLTVATLTVATLTIAAALTVAALTVTAAPPLRRHLDGHDLDRDHDAGAGGCRAHPGLAGRHRHPAGRRHPDGRRRLDGRSPP